MRSTNRARRINLNSYRDFEKLDSFGGEMEKYRADKLGSAAGHVGFIKRLLGSRELNVLELGSGNSKTLFAMERAGILGKGYGIEISRSRYEFAERWKKDWRFKKVHNICGDAIGFDINSLGPIDLCLCVDLAFQFFEPVRSGSAQRILKNIGSVLTPGGKIILELDGCARVIERLKDDRAKLWDEFAPPDPWRYSLWDCAYEKRRKLLTFKKTFIKRDDPEISKSEAVLRIYTKDEISRLLSGAGYRNIKAYAGWHGKPFRDDTFEYIITGER